VPSIDIQLPPLHAGQRIVAADKSRFRVLACGRRWGKTVLMGSLCYEAAVNTGGRTWWVWPNYRVSKPGWRFVERIGLQIREGWPGVRINQTDRTVYLPSGGEVTIQTADDPTKLVGEGLVRIAVDEAGTTPAKAWEESLQPTLLDAGGDAIIGGVPKGRTWFQGAYLRGQDPAATDWASWQFSTFDNPTLPAKILAAERLRYERGEIPDRIWRQEYLAEFLDDSGMVFRRVADAATAVWQDAPVPGHSYVFGVDWGKSNDYTVIAVWDLDLEHLVHLDRMREIDYAFQVSRLRSLYDRFRPTRILAERNSIGEPLIEQLQRTELPITPFMTTGASKWTAIEDLSLAIESGQVAIVPDPTLIGELQAYERTERESGVPRYSAPDGLHDDCVMAAAIGYAGVKTGEFGMLALG
jgi:hypothetical protein